MEQMPMGRKEWVYTCNWDHIMGTTGLRQYELKKNGDLVFVREIDPELSCGSTWADPERRILYVANEVGDLPGRHGGGGRILAYMADPENGDLTLLCEAETLCPNPSYICASRNRKFLLVSNHSGMGAVTKVIQDEKGHFQAKVIYDDATVDLFLLEPDGRIGELKDVAVHLGSGPGFKQFHPHPHCVVPSPLFNLYAVCDKGNDNIYFYGIDKDRKKLTIIKDAIYHDDPGSVPRYGVFHPKKNFFFCNHERTPMVHSFSYTRDGRLTLLDSVAASEEEKTRNRGVEQQDIVISEDGNFLYTLVRGHGADRVNVIGISPEGKLSRVQEYELQGRWPRGCTFSCDGGYLMVACMESGTIETCRVGTDGKLCRYRVTEANPGISSITVMEV